MRCFECGYCNPAGARFCDHCGKRMTKQLITLDNRSPSEAKLNAGDGFYPARFDDADDSRQPGSRLLVATKQIDSSGKSAISIERADFHPARFSDTDPKKLSRLKRAESTHDFPPNATGGTGWYDATKMAPAHLDVAAKNKDDRARASWFHTASFHHSKQPKNDPLYAGHEEGTHFTSKGKPENGVWKTPRVIDEREINRTMRDTPTEEIMIEPPPKTDQRFKPNWKSVFFAPLIVLALLFALLIMTVIFHDTEQFLYRILIAVMVVIGLSGGAIDYLLQATQWRKSSAWKKAQYEAYLQNLGQEWNLRAERQLQTQIIQDPSIEGCVALMESQSERIWERKADDEDFLCVRIGRGKRAFELGILTPPISYVEREEVLYDSMRELVETHRYISPAPVLCDLKQQALFVITGNHNETTQFMQGLLIHLATFHSPELVEIVLLGAERDLRDWSIFGRLPHVRCIQKEPEEDCGTRESDIQNLYQERRQMFRLNRAAEEKRNNRFLVLVVFREAILGEEDRKTLSALANREWKTCVIMQSSSENNLPPQTDLIMHIAGESGKLYHRTIDGTPQQIRLDSASNEQINRCQRALSRRLIEKMK